MSARPVGDHSPKHLRLGQTGEEIAWKLLRSKGYSLLAKNWTAHRHELDIICEDGDTLVFVEVKTRGINALGKASDALTSAKMKKLVKAAAYYLSHEQFWDRPCRFDLVALESQGSGLHAVHFENAFDISGLPGLGRIWQP